MAVNDWAHRKYPPSYHPSMRTHALCRVVHLLQVLKESEPIWRCSTAVCIAIDGFVYAACLSLATVTTAPQNPNCSTESTAPLGLALLGVPLIVPARKRLGPIEMR